MSNTLPIWCAAIAFALGAGLSAQTSTTKPQIPSGTTIPPSGHAVPQPQTAPPAASPTAPTVTASGCLERWPGGGTAAGAADKGPAGVTFVLTGIQGETTSAVAAGASKTTTTSPQARYLLLPDPKVDYAAHLNHRVKLTGKIAPQPAPGASVVDSIADPATRETNLPPDGDKPAAYHDNLIEVSTLTMVARTCGH